MGQPTVDEILAAIDALPESDQELLDRKLAERAEAAWQAEAAQARELARARGVDQAAIDAAIQARRYGP